MASRRFPFTIAEALQLLGEEHEPSCFQQELTFTGTLDAERLAAAVRAAIALHPMARARRADARRAFHRPQWEIVDIERCDLHDTVQMIRCEGEDQLSAARDAFYSRPIPIDGRPPLLRFLLVRRADGDSLLLAMHHALCDGVGSLRFLHSVARAYTGRTDPVPAIDPVAARLQAHWAASSKANREPRVRRERLLARRPVLVAADGGVEAPGYGFCHLALSAEQTASLNPRRLLPEASVNDLLLVALNRSIERWNAAHGRAAGRIALLMPINARPPAWRTEVVANVVAARRISTTPAERDNLNLLTQAVIRQTGALKQSGTPSAGALPTWLETLGIVLLPLLVRGVPLTMILTNLGRLSDVPDFGAEAGELLTILSAPPVHSPFGVGLAAVTLNGRLNLSLRFRRTRFDAAAGKRFLDSLVDELLVLGAGNAIGAAETVPQMRAVGDNLSG